VTKREGSAGRKGTTKKSTETKGSWGPEGKRTTEPDSIGRLKFLVKEIPRRVAPDCKVPTKGGREGVIPNGKILSQLKSACSAVNQNM